MKRSIVCGSFGFLNGVVYTQAFKGDQLAIAIILLGLNLFLFMIYADLRVKDAK